MKSLYYINVESFFNYFYLVIYVFLTIFLFGITMGKVIDRTYKYDQRNWPFPSPNTNFFIPPHSDTSRQTQPNSSSDSSVGAQDVASAGLYQSTNQHGNMDVKDNDYSQSFETPRKLNCSSSSFDVTITTITKPQSSSLPPPRE